MKQLFFLLFMILYGCSERNPSSGTTVFSGTAMTIEYHITIGSVLDEEQSLLVQQVVRTVFDEVDSIYNNWNPESEISHLNQLGAYEKAALSPQMEHLLKIVDRIVFLTQGRFDPTIAPIQQLWKSRLAEGLLPNDTEVEQASKWVGWDKIHFENGFFWKEYGESALDLGGIAKGYAIDLFVENLQRTGHENIFVEWGGEVRAAGRHPSGRPWTVFISRLGDPDPAQAVDIVALENEAIATSGDYMQNWTVSLKDRRETFFHIMDPRTCRPLTITSDSIASVSLIASTCALADGLATAAMVFDSPLEAERWLSSLPEVKVKRSWIIKGNGT